MIKDSVKSRALRSEVVRPGKIGRKKDESIRSMVFWFLAYPGVGLFLFFRFCLDELVTSWYEGFYTALGIGAAYCKFEDVSLLKKYYIFLSH